MEKLPRRRLALLTSLMFLLVAGCGTPSSVPSTGGAATGAPAQSTGPKRVVAAIMGDPTTFSYAVSRAGSGGIPGVDALEQLVNAGLTEPDDKGSLRPQLAQAVPSIDNGQWQLFPDGRMQTSWKIRAGALWHDGTPVTSDDLAFTVQVGTDRDIPALGNAAYASIDGVDTPDPSTVIVRWSKPFIQADAMFTYNFAVPLPKHLLEHAYTDDKANFTQVPYWTQDFVGTGPFKLRDFSRSSYAILVANQNYILGRPKIDEVELRFIPDPNAIIASILAGEVELTMGRGLSLEQATQVRDQWPDGKMAVSLNSWLAAYPQMLNPTPPIVTDVRFRRALIEAIDRQAMVDTLQAGQSAVAHSYVSPNTAEFNVISTSIVKYDFDVRKAGDALQDLGYAKGGDGFFHDAAGQRLGLEIRTTGGDDLQEKTMLSIADNWQHLGVSVDPVVVPRQRAADREYRANFPAFEEVRQPNDLTPDSLTRYYGPESALPENQYRGGNRMRYQNPELDALIERFYVTVPKADREQVLAQIVHHMTDQVIPIGLFYNAGPIMIGNRLLNVGAGGSQATPAWNAEQWDVR
ncbi:MAG TPA: peptide ABC transporter substrate-binding protein [Chloroflexota bacterium]|nr:peptide ABC transporter substrate-binding protein [Chloroflexota bacterium]